MTDEQKEILIEKMIDRPAQLTADEIGSITSDRELRDLYEMAVLAKDALRPAPRIDMAEEWRRLRPRLAPRVPSRRSILRLWWPRVAAVLVGIALLSGVLLHFSNSTTETTPEAPLLAVATPLTETDAVSASPADTLETLVCEPTMPRVEKKRHAKPRAVEVEEESGEIDVEEYLRIQQARIDNDIAMQIAEIYATEYYTIQDNEISPRHARMVSTAMPGGDMDIEDSDFTKLIMQ